MRLNKNKQVLFNEFLHEYTLESTGELLIGVTSLMKKHGLGPDYGDAPKEVLEKAAARGTEIHKMLEDYDNGVPVLENDILSAYKKLGLKVHCSEYLVSDNKMVASFIDKVLEDCSLVDVKTTSKVHTEAVAWQLSIYKKLFLMQNPNKKVPHLYCCHIDLKKMVAKLIELKPIDPAEVDELFLAEAEGRIYKKKEVQAVEIISQTELTELVDAFNNIAAYQSLLKAEEERSKALTEKLRSYMSEHSLKKVQCDFGVFTLKEDSTRTSIDTNRLKAERPEIAAEYSKVTSIRGGVVFKSAT